MQEAVIGLGSMGFGMAALLARAGFPVTGFDVRPEAVARFSAGHGKGDALPAAAATGADAVVTVVVNADQTEEVLFGVGGAAAAMPQGAVIVSCATMAPERARALAKSAETRGHLVCRRADQRRGDARRGGRAYRPCFGVSRCHGQGGAGSRGDLGHALPARRRAGDRRLVQDGQPAACRRPHRGGERGDRLRQAPRPRPRESLRGDHRLGGQFVEMFENRVPHVLAGDYTPRSAVEIFTKDLGIIVDMARSHTFATPIAAAALAGFPDDRQPPAWASTTMSWWRASTPRSRELTCRASPISATREHATMTPETYEILAIKYAEFTNRRRFESSSPPTTRCPPSDRHFIWVIRNPRRTIVVDSGYDEAEGRGGNARCPRAPSQAWRWSASRSSLEQLVITHLHWDHAGTSAFPNARFHLQAAEMAYATGPCMCHAHPALRSPPTTCARWCARSIPAG